MSEISDGLFLMGVGMGTVFLFLCLLIAATEGLRMLYGEEPPTPSGPSGTPRAKDDEGVRTAVIAAAITRHRQGKQGPGD